MSGVHEPRQRRSREKVARILEVTASLLETTSYDDLGTKVIAAEAGVSVGVLYRYFADKEAIVASLMRRWLQLDVQIAERVTAEPLPERSQDLLAKLITAYADRFREEPGYRRIWYHGPRIASLRADTQKTDREIADLVHRALVRGYAMPDTDTSRRRGRLAVEVASTLLDLAFRDDPLGDTVVLADAALMMDRYLFAPATGAD
ncbi:TetR family transcriptional regulator [Streptomyces capoamus]|uniref:TetR family transcriptional regulator n=1 Tax=Streptomyces capoamus TaxID=68183 RepID=A0A919C130_9ACTN|nr:TetR/AcrR family transcriptional regulator [Streptomyces capoamus]GGW12266.1 TetR family transcriptional regulator [Streptomyces libani subsp. rufus]GHG34247.1 TetR family transcriptional regulator [Streptomyces capoamus]